MAIFRDKTSEINNRMETTIISDMVQGMLAPQKYISSKYLYDAPDKSKSTTSIEILKLIQSAKKSIKIVTAYPFFVDKMKNILHKKSEENVSIEVFMANPASIKHEYSGLYDVFLTQLASYQSLGLNLYENYGFLHSKILIVDDEVAFVGSHNFDDIGFNFSTENGMILRGESFISSLVAKVESYKRVFD